MLVFLAPRRDERVELISILIDNRVNLRLVSVWLSCFAKRAGPLPLVLGMEGASQTVPIYAASFDPDFLLEKTVNAWGVYAHPGAVECLRLSLRQKVVHGGNGRLEVHGVDFSTTGKGINEWCEDRIRPTRSFYIQLLRGIYLGYVVVVLNNSRAISRDWTNYKIPAASTINN